MQEINKDQIGYEGKDEIDLIEILNVLLKGKFTIISITAIASLIVVLYSLSLPNIYQSTALLAPYKTSDNISSSLRGYGNIANIAGINLSPENSESNAVKAKQKLYSLSFFENNILPNIFLPDLMAIDSWDVDRNKIIYDEDIYNASSGKWVRDFQYPQKLIPSAQEGYKVFSQMHLTISEENLTGFITLSVKHQSPFVAKEWVELIVSEINNFYRTKDKAEAERSVLFLNDQITKTNLAEMKEVVANLLQQETQKLMLVEANESYVYEYIDPPALMEKKSEPSRAIICIIGFMMGGVFGVLYVLLRHYGRKEFFSRS